MPASIPEAQPVPSRPSATGAASFRRVLKNRNFVLLWLAQLISLAILNATNFGIIVLVNDVTHSVFMAGIAIIAFTFPFSPQIPVQYQIPVSSLPTAAHFLAARESVSRNVPAFPYFGPPGSE